MAAGALQAILEVVQRRDSPPPTHSVPAGGGGGGGGGGESGGAQIALFSLGNLCAHAGEACVRVCVGGGWGGLAGRELRRLRSQLPNLPPPPPPGPPPPPPPPPECADALLRMGLPEVMARVLEQRGGDPTFSKYGARVQQKLAARVARRRAGEGAALS